MTLRSVFPKKDQMIAAIVWLLPMWTQFRKCAVGNIVPSLTSLKKHGPELNFFVSIFGKLHDIKIQNCTKWQPSKFLRFLLTTISHTYGTLKPPWRAAISKENGLYLGIFNMLISCHINLYYFTVTMGGQQIIYGLYKT